MMRFQIRRPVWLMVGFILVGAFAAWAFGVDANTLGKPTYTDSKDGVHVQMWLITKQQYNQLSSGSADSRSGSGDGASAGANAMKPDMALVSIDDANRPVQTATVELAVVPPSKSATSVMLMPSGSYYTGDLALTESGSYTFSVKVTNGGKTTTVDFEEPFTAS